MSSPSRATTSSASTSATPRPRPRRCSRRRWAACSSSTRRTTCTAPRTRRTTARRPSRSCLQVMENQRDDLVVIFAGYQDRMEKFFSSNPGISSRIAHHIDFPDYTDEELLQIAELMLAEWNYHFDAEGAADVRGVPRDPPDTPTFRQRALGSQRPRPDPTAPGTPAVRGSGDRPSPLRTSRPSAKTRSGRAGCSRSDGTGHGGSSPMSIRHRPQPAVG